MIRNFSFLFFLILHAYVYCQDALKGELQYTERTAYVNRVSNLEIGWEIALTSKQASVNKSPLSKEELEHYIAASTAKPRRISSPKRQQINAPRLFMNFEGNKTTGSVPPDNTIGVSHNGFVISSINSTILFANGDGTITYSSGLSDFFRVLGLGGNFFDPKIIYDIEARRFIVVALSGNMPSNSKIAVAFSETENPNLGWNFYKFNGDVLNENYWFDYPSIGITDKELFIAGNLFTEAPDTDFGYTVIYQIDKNLCYQGKTTRQLFHAKLKAPDGRNYFNLTPVNGGWNSSPQGKMHFITNQIYGDDKIIFTSIAESLDGTPKFKTEAVVKVDEFNISPRVGMPNTDKVLQTGDCRVQYGILLGSVVHYVFKASAGEGLGGFYYGRYDLGTGLHTSSLYFEPDVAISYPSIASFGKNEQDSTVLINFLRGGNNLFPEQGGIVCTGTKDNFTYSPSVVLRKGDNYINALTQEAQRWGDYTSACRRVNHYGTPEVWGYGCYGKLSFGSQIGQYIDTDSNYIDFFPSLSEIVAGDTVSMIHTSIDSLVDIVYQIDGARQDSSLQSNQFVFDSIGVYSVTMKSVDINTKSQTILKKDLIYVIEPDVVPIANFTASDTMVYVGDTIQFFDMSINKPESWSWNFIGGTPAKSDLQNPKIHYKKKGLYSIILSVSNDAGDNVKAKLKYIQVEDRPQLPKSDFIVNKNIVPLGDSISLIDQSTNLPKNWVWRLTNYVDYDSTVFVKNPILQMNKLGTYDVKLIVSNDAGADTLLRLSAFSVTEPLAVKDVIIGDKVYPNPVDRGVVYLDFELNQSMKTEFILIDREGKRVKYLINKNLGKGVHQLSFHTDHIPSGLYYLQMNKFGGSLIKSYPLQIN